LIFRTLRWTTSILYSGLSLLAAIVAIISQNIPMWSSSLMILGAILLFIFNFSVFCKKIYLVIIPLLLIHISALVNGVYGNGIIILHQIVRLAVSVLIFVLFYFSSKRKVKSLL